MTKADWQSVLASLRRADWRAAHEVVQRHEGDRLADWAHGIVHILEGDEANARYWYGVAKRPYSPAATVAEEISALESSLDLRA